MGRSGERKAERYLKKKKYKILDINFKTRFGEADIIAKDKDYIVFVEVKTRSSDRYGSPSEAVNFRKQEKYFMVASEYLMKNDLSDAPCRFDVVEVLGDKINHIENAFLIKNV